MVLTIGFTKFIGAFIGVVLNMMKRRNSRANRAARNSSSNSSGLDDHVVEGRNQVGVRHVRRPLIERRRLEKELDVEVPLTLLRAPIGFGKTTLVRQWADRRTTTDRILAEVRVRPGGGDSDSFWASVVEALGDAGLAMPALTQNRSWQSLAERMITSNNNPLLLWIDNFENVTVDAADQVLLDLLVHTPMLRLIVCMRGERHFRDQLLGGLDWGAVTARELLFTVEETAQLMKAAGFDLSETDIRDIHTASGGWPEPTRMFALRFGTSEGADLVATGNQVAAEWLQQRLLPEDTEPDLVALALTMSLPKDFSAALAEAVTDDPAAGIRLKTLAQYGVLLVEARDGEPVYRWPEAARRALKTTLRQRDADRVPIVHARLASWYLDHRHAGDALHHAMRAHDPKLVVTVIEHAWRELLLAHQPELHEALLSTPLNVIATSARASAVRDIWLGGPGNPLLTDAESRLPLGTHEPAGNDSIRDTLDTRMAILVALRRRGLFDQATAKAIELLTLTAAARDSHPEQVTDLVPSIQLVAGQTLLLADDSPGSLEPLQRAYDWAADAAFDYVGPDAAASLALSHAVQGRLGDATNWLRRYGDTQAPTTWMQPSIRGKVAVAHVLVALDMLDLDSVEEIVRNDASDERIGVQEWWAFRLFARARYAVHVGTMLDALQAIDRDRTLFKRWAGEGSAAFPLLAAAEVDLLLALGRGNQARNILNGPLRDHQLLRIGQARLALLAGENDAVLRLATDVSWQRRASARDQHEMLVVHAIAAHRTGDRQQAIATLAQAVDTARSTGTIRPFATVPRVELAALADLVSSATEMLQAPALVASREIFPASIQLIHLTEREQRVLEKIAAGLSIHQVATALRVSYSTVRTQQRSLYRKLQAESQSDAVARAQRAGLLAREVSAP
jgi:LuxR family maltose regulon positive regulatory protein